jgi:hypothetical protein
VVWRSFKKFCAELLAAGYSFTPYQTAEGCYTFGPRQINGS